ncbi:GNAT family N-acetyltransferase [Streptomyces afghaniensis]|uniref:GNAT family N-acetyltransferase n=1 Tax=Streptomyces afghaniensis TaxID=66865 RepID=UPI0027855BF5|nr:GNAT family N-acetyltransferase [Streptomyces afghaniensis]MDQ1015821.1 RimJ/RimL family protein N-acetyltransferase [Streptomyces afghaniensis]
MPSADPTAHAGAAVPATADVNAGAGSNARFDADSDAGSGVDSSTGADADSGADSDADSGADSDADSGADSGAAGHGEDTMDLWLPDELLALVADGTSGRHGVGRPDQGTDDLLDRVVDWGPTDTPAGVFHLVPVRVQRDPPLISRWMNDPAAAAFWELSGPQKVTEDHVLSQLAGDGRSVPCIGVLDGTPMSYWEIYRADLDPLARHYPARPHDTGLHLLIGTVADRGRGLGGLLLRAVADLVLARRHSCARVIAEPDIRNTPSVAAFLTAGFRFSAEVEVPGKRAALMVRDRSLRHLM